MFEQNTGRQSSPSVVPLEVNIEIGCLIQVDQINRQGSHCVIVIDGRSLLFTAMRRPCLINVLYIYRVTNTVCIPS